MDHWYEVVMLKVLYTSIPLVVVLRFFCFFCFPGREDINYAIIILSPSILYHHLSLPFPFGLGKYFVLFPFRELFLVATRWILTSTYYSINKKKVRNNFNEK